MIQNIITGIVVVALSWLLAQPFVSWSKGIQEFVDTSTPVANVLAVVLLCVFSILLAYTFGAWNMDYNIRAALKSQNINLNAVDSPPVFPNDVWTGGLWVIGFLVVYYLAIYACLACAKHVLREEALERLQYQNNHNPAPTSNNDNGKSGDNER